MGTGKVSALKLDAIIDLKAADKGTATTEMVIDNNGNVVYSNVKSNPDCVFTEAEKAQLKALDTVKEKTEETYQKAYSPRDGVSVFEVAHEVTTPIKKPAQVPPVVIDTPKEELKPAQVPPVVDNTPSDSGFDWAKAGKWALGIGGGLLILLLTRGKIKKGLAGLFKSKKAPKLLTYTPSGATKTVKSTPTPTKKWVPLEKRTTPLSPAEREALIDKALWKESKKNIKEVNKQLRHETAVRHAVESENADIAFSQAVKRNKRLTQAADAKKAKEFKALKRDIIARDKKAYKEAMARNKELTKAPALKQQQELEALKQDMIARDKKAHVDAAIARHKEAKKIEKAMAWNENLTKSTDLQAKKASDKTKNRMIANAKKEAAQAKKAAEAAEKQFKLSHAGLSSAEYEELVSTHGLSAAEAIIAEAKATKITETTAKSLAKTMQKTSKISKTSTVKKATATQKSSKTIATKKAAKTAKITQTQYEEMVTNLGQADAEAFIKDNKITIIADKVSKTSKKASTTTTLASKKTTKKVSSKDVATKTNHRLGIGTGVLLRSF